MATRLGLVVSHRERRQTALGAAALAPWLLAIAPPVNAQDRPGVTLSTSFTAQYDDNVYRLPRDLPVSALGPRAQSRADTTFSPEARLEANTTLSRQRLSVVIDRALQRYQENDVNNGSTGELAARWQGSFPEGFTSDVNLSHTTTRSDFSDVRADERNNQTSDTRAIELTWQLRPDRRILATYSATRGRNSLAINRFNNFDTESFRLEVSAISDLNRSLGLGLTASSTDYVNPLRTFFGTFDSSYEQSGIDAVFSSALGSFSSVQGRIGYVSRRYRTSSQRNFDGINGSVTTSWLLSGKSRVAASWVQDNSTTGDLFKSASRSTAINLNLNYQLSTKVATSLDIGRTKTSYGVNGQAFSNTLDDEVTRTRALNVTWAGIDALSVGASISRLSRDAADALLTSRTTLSRLSVRYQVRGPW